MNKVLIFIASFLLGSNVSAGVVGVDNVEINEIAAYDDYEGGIIRIEMSNSHSVCPVGGYLNPNSPGFERLYSLLLIQASTGKSARFQLYDDRVIGSLCEVDGIRLKF